ARISRDTGRTSSGDGQTQHSRYGEPHRRLRSRPGRDGEKVRSSSAGPILYLHRTRVLTLQRAELSEEPGGNDRTGASRRRKGPKDSQNARPLSSGKYHQRSTRED